MDYYVVDGDTPLVKLQADASGAITAVEKAEPDSPEWAYESALEFYQEGSLGTVSQVTRYFGRGAESMTAENYATRRVTKRDTGDDLADLIAENEEAVDLRADGEILKTDPEQQIVFGWAYVAIDKSGEVNVDKSGDFIDQIEEIEKSAYDYVLRSRQSDADHTNVKGGEMVESIVFTPDKIEKMGIPEGVVPLGWWVGYKIEDAATWERVKKGELKAFSIHGSGTRTKVAP